MIERIRAKVKATGKIVEVALKRKRIDIEPDLFVDLNVTDMKGNCVKYYHMEELEPVIENPPQSEATISGWVARDRNGSLSLYQTFPERQESLDYWRDGLGEFDLSETDFPDLTWESDPVEVEIIIKPKKEC